MFPRVLLSSTDMYVKYTLTVLATLVLITATGTTVNFTIQTKEFDIRDCSTSCLSGLIADADILILHSSLKISNIISITNLILIVELKTTKSFKFATIYYEELQVCLNRTSQKVKCDVIKEDYFNITIKYNATSKFSEASLKVAVLYEGTYVSGNVIQLPHISDTMKSTLLLNNDRLSLMSHKCDTDLIRNGSLHFCCEENNIVRIIAIIKLNGAVFSKSERCTEIQMGEYVENLTVLDFECNFCNVQHLKTSCHYGNYSSGDTSDTLRVFYLFVLLRVALICIMQVAILCLFKKFIERNHTSAYNQFTSGQEQAENTSDDEETRL